VEYTDRRVARLAKSQCRPRISDNTSRDRNDDPMRIALDRDRMVWPRDLDVSGFRSAHSDMAYSFNLASGVPAKVMRPGTAK
jgi:hypothetical protein